MTERQPLTINDVLARAWAEMEQAGYLPFRAPPGCFFTLSREAWALGDLKDRPDEIRTTIAGIRCEVRDDQTEPIELWIPEP